MNVFFAGSATEDDKPEVVMQDKKNTGALLTFFDIYSNRSITIKRMEAIKERNRKTKEHKVL